MMKNFLKKFGKCNPNYYLCIIEKIKHENYGKSRRQNSHRENG